MNLMPPLPALRHVTPLPPLAPLPTTDQLLEKMVVVMWFDDGHGGGTWQARTRGTKYYGPCAPTPRQAMIAALAGTARMAAMETPI